MEKQIAAPITIPYDLELHIRGLHSHLAQSVFPNSTHLIPVHDPTRHDAANAFLPSLSSNATDESGNLRYVVITNESMWAGQHRVLDEISEIYWILFHWLIKSVLFEIGSGTQSSACVFHMADGLRERVLPEFIIDDTATRSCPPIPEALLFRAWAFCKTRARYDTEDKANKSAHELFEEEAIRYPFPDELFWNEGDEGDGVDGNGEEARWEEVASSGAGGNEGGRAG